MLKNNLVEQLRTFENHWVALPKEQDKVIANGKSLKETIANAKGSGCKEPIYFFVPSQEYGYAPACK